VELVNSSIELKDVGKLEKILRLSRSLRDFRGFNVNISVFGGLSRKIDSVQESWLQVKQWFFAKEV
jgi:hypothetical protein